MNPAIPTTNCKKCVVCGTRRSPGSTVFLARLPLDPIRCKAWVKAIGQEDFIHVPIEKLHDLKYVCDKHFKREDFNHSKTRLLKRAVPTLNMPANPLSDELLANFPLHICQEPAIRFDAPASSLIVTQRKVVPISTRKRTIPSISVQDTPLNVIGDNILKPSTATYQGIKRKIDQTDILQDIPTPSTSTDQGTQKKIDQTDIIQDIPTPSTSTDQGTKKKIDQTDAVIPGTSDTKFLVRGYYRSKKNPAPTKELTSREKMLLKKLQNTKLTLRELSRTHLDLDKLNNETLKNLVADAVKNYKKKPTGKRWTIKTKLWSLAIFKRSPKAYRFLEWALPVPSVKTLQRLLKQIPLEAGLNMKLIHKLKQNIRNLHPLDKNCALIFDEIALKKRLIFNEGTDKIEGFEDFGDHRSENIADHALVMMVQGLRKKYKQPIAYYFVKGTISTQNLLKILKEVIRCLRDVGLNVVNTICDQGPTNVGALNMLKTFNHQNPDDNFFIVDEQKVYIIYDIPHLFKSIRNNFYNAGMIKFGDKVGKWSHLIEAESRNTNFLNFHKINKNVVHPSYKNKMRVKFAAHALSNTMAAILKMLSWNHTQSNEIMATAEIIQDLDKLFDICNGPSSPKDIKKGLRENVSPKTNHVEGWRYFLEKMDHIKFLKSNSGLQLYNVRCIKGFKISLKSLIDIWFHLQKDGFKYLNLRQLNQDSLENLFGIIRQHSPTNSNPTCSMFTAALKTSILTGLTAPHNRGSNCEEDNNKLIFDYSSSDPPKEVETAVGPVETIVDENIIPVLSIPDMEELCEFDFSNFEDQPVVYVSGFLAFKLLKCVDCLECKTALTCAEVDENLHKYICLREWWQDKKSLTYPSNELCKTVNSAKTIFTTNIVPQIYKNDIAQICTTEFIVNLNVTWYCSQHDPTNLFKIMSKLFIRKYCKIENEKLSGFENKSADSRKRDQQQSLAYLVCMKLKPVLLEKSYQELELNFRLYTRSVVGLACNLHRGRELRTLFHDLLERCVEPLRQGAWPRSDLAQFLRAYEQCALQMDVFREADLRMVWERYMKVVRRCVLVMYSAHA